MDCSAARQTSATPRGRARRRSSRATRPARSARRCCRCCTWCSRRQGQVSPAGVDVLRRAARPHQGRGRRGRDVLHDVQAPARPANTWSASARTRCATCWAAARSSRRSPRSSVSVTTRRSADGKITLEHAECLAACDYAPVVTVNYDFYDNQTAGLGARPGRRSCATGRGRRRPAAPRLCTFKEMAVQLAGLRRRPRRRGRRRPCRASRRCAATAWPSSTASVRRATTRTRRSRPRRRRTEEMSDRPRARGAGEAHAGADQALADAGRLEDRRVRAARGLPRAAARRSRRTRTT